jgi:hypothetical protein
MNTITSGKSAIMHLNSVWREFISVEMLSDEIEYRLEKLILRLNVVADKIFIKTVKAHNILLNCIQLTEQFQSKINKHRDAAFLHLTHLEDCVDDLVQKTHEFRIKAG